MQNPPNKYDQTLAEIVYPNDQLTDEECSAIQGLMLRRYPFKLNGVQHLLCRITDAEAFRNHLSRLLINGQITFGHDDQFKGNISANLCFTHPGLKKALSLANPVEKEFDTYIDANFPTYKEGLSQENAEAIGDIWAEWDSNFKKPADLIFTCYFPYDEQEINERHIPETYAGPNSGLEIKLSIVGRERSGGKEHFGFRDGISQPWINGGPKPYFVHEKAEERVEPWTLVLRDYYKAMYSLHHPDYQVNDPKLGPKQLGFNNKIKKLFLNGSFAAFRKLSQDVANMENFTNQVALAGGLNHEWIQSRMVGRWKNGSPISIFPDAPDSNYDLLDMHMEMCTESAEEWEALCREDIHMRKIIQTINDIHYNSTGENCPYGAHIRRTNPRESVIAGRSDIRRIIRRVMSYGPDYKPYDSGSAYQERGLVGYFACTKLKQVFQHLHAQWMNNGRFIGLQDGEKDPILGNNPGKDDDEEGMFTINMKQANMTINAVPRMVIPRGGAYVFFPNLNGLQLISQAFKG